MYGSFVYVYGSLVYLIGLFCVVHLYMCMAVWFICICVWLFSVSHRTLLRNTSRSRGASQVIGACGFAFVYIRVWLFCMCVWLFCIRVWLFSASHRTLLRRTSQSRGAPKLIFAHVEEATFAYTFKSHLCCSCMYIIGLFCVCASFAYAHDFYCSFLHIPHQTLLRM